MIFQEIILFPSLLLMGGRAGGGEVAEVTDVCIGIQLYVSLRDLNSYIRAYLATDPSLQPSNYF